MNHHRQLSKSAAPATYDFERLIAPLLPLLRRFAMKLTRDPDDCEDLVQEVMLKLVEHRERLDNVQMLKPWLMRVVYHQFIDDYRRHAPLRNAVSLSEFSEVEPTDGWDGVWDGGVSSDDQPEVHFEQLQVDAAVQAAIRRLPQDQRVLVDMHEIQGLTIPHIAQQLSLSVNTIKSSLARARMGLRRRLDTMHEADVDTAPPSCRKPRVSSPARRFAAAR